MVQKYDRFQIQEPETETNLAVSVAAGIGSGLIKIPLGLVSVAAELYDATQGEGVNYDESAVARLEKFIDDSVVGDVINGSEDKARDTAAGRITEALVQVGVPAARAAKIAGNIAVKVVGGIQKGKRVRHICAEGPEPAIYIRGKLEGEHIIKLPDYWKGLVDYDTITVNLTPFGRRDNLYVKDIQEDRIIVAGDYLANVNCFYQVWVARWLNPDNHADKLHVVYDGESPADYPGDNNHFSFSLPPGYHE